ncbi:AAC(3) family N-acetyltransferase [Streptomyces bambusae]|uniref:aminoglycoside N(3)-acetyltransferase n=1 Tax=Streptomyces bambusae TaxID=1550616 RepID=UPI001CFF5E09|nr:AAC(3) family N-acetyltransferase [Streptomyces bambusae]MCB5169887.1 AAC(3) family N-acetyltransferase [Streptomyces bambusae]
MNTLRTTLHSDTRLTDRFRALGVAAGGVLMVHASMRALGPAGPPGGRGSEVVLRALRAALGPSGTLVVPTFTPENSDTSPHYREQVRGLSPEEVAALRDRMPAFDRAVTPAPTMGVLAETARQAPGALRSGHPQTSFAALGPAAGRITVGHRPDCHLGEDSPLARLYELDARVLLLGVGFDRCTAFHLAEYRVPAPPRRTYRCVVVQKGVRRWWEYEDVALDDSDFAAVGADFAGPGGAPVRTGTVGSADCRLFSFRDAVDFARIRLPAHRG